MSIPKYVVIIPDFSLKDLRKVVEDFSKRNRRLGK